MEGRIVISDSDRRAMLLAALTAIIYIILEAIL